MCPDVTIDEPQGADYTDILTRHHNLPVARRATSELSVLTYEAVHGTLSGTASRPWKRAANLMLTTQSMNPHHAHTLATVRRAELAAEATASRNSPHSAPSCRTEPKPTPDRLARWPGGHVPSVVSDV